VRPIHVWRAFIYGIPGILAAFEYVLFSGFCFSDMRYVGNAEFVERALIYRAAAIKELSNIVVPSRADVLGYLEKNPNCCRIEGPTFFMNSSIKDRLFGFKLTWVRIVHQRSDGIATVSTKEAILHQVHIGLNRCGLPFRSIATSSTDTYAGHASGASTQVAQR